MTEFSFQPFRFLLFYFAFENDEPWLPWFFKAALRIAALIEFSSIKAWFGMENNKWAKNSLEWLESVVGVFHRKIHVQFFHLIVSFGEKIHEESSAFRLLIAFDINPVCVNLLNCFRSFSNPMDFLLHRLSRLDLPPNSRQSFGPALLEVTETF